MSQRRPFESAEEYSARSKEEALEGASGLTRLPFESLEDFEKRATAAAIENISGVKRFWFETDDAYTKRASQAALEEVAETHQYFLESKTAFEQRAVPQAVEIHSGTTQHIFESSKTYMDRAVPNLADDLSGKRGYTFLLQQKASEHVKAPQIAENQYTPTYSESTSKSSNSDTHILKGIGFGLLADLAIYIFTFGGFLLDLFFGTRNYNFVLLFPPIIGGIIGAFYRD